MGIVVTPRASGVVVIASRHDQYPQMKLSAIYAFDTGPSPQLLTLAEQTSMANAGVDDLTQSPGVVDHVSVSANPGVLQIGNRYGSHSFALTFPCYGDCQALISAEGTLAVDEAGWSFYSLTGIKGKRRT